MKKLALVVDDSMYFRKAIISILEEYNFEIIEAKNGLEAIEKYKEYSPMLVTMDINMPLVDGFTATQKIIEYDKNAKILICSSMMYLDVYIAEGIQKAIKEAGFVPYQRNQDYSPK